ncbi:MAG: hypothetical protein Q8N99_00540 [Nanoarchaeota archaeon]|nr:hypothetical protein [Nanoarchaeota archaeon]
MKKRIKKLPKNSKSIQQTWRYSLLNFMHPINSNFSLFNFTTNLDALNSKLKIKKQALFIAFLIINLYFLAVVYACTQNSDCEEGFVCNTAGKCDGSSESWAQITTRGNLVCKGDHWEDQSTTPYTITLTTGPDSNCYSPRQDIPGFCCPSSYTCIPSGIGSSGIRGNCTITYFDNCFDIKNDIECNNWSYYNNPKANKAGEILYGTIDSNICKNFDGNTYNSGAKTDCSNKTLCKCVWIVDNSNPQNSKCGVNITRNETCRVGGLSTIGTCQVFIESVDDDCEYTGIMTFNVQKTWSGTGTDSNCVGSQIQVPCGSVAKLSFFNWINVIIVVIVIGVIYYFYYKRTRTLKNLKKEKNRIHYKKIS